MTQWRQLIDLPSDLRRYIGPPSRAGEAVTEDFVRASQVGAAADGERVAAEIGDIQDTISAWARQGFVHWCDLELADAWFRRAMFLTDDDHTMEVDGLGYFEQIRRFREALDALMAGYQALDVPCVIDPCLRAVVERDTEGPSTNPCDKKRWAAWARHNGAYLTEGGGACVFVHERVRFNGQSISVPSNHFAGECESDGSPRDTDWTHHFGLRGGRWCWNSWAFRHDCLHRGGFLQAGACADAISHFLAPLRCYWDWVQEISRACVRRGPARILVESMRFALMLNAREALQLRDRMTPNERRDTAGQFAALERISREDLARAQDGGEFFRRPLETPFGTFTPNEMFAGLSGAAGLVAGPAALLVSLVYGVARLLVSWLPAAVAHNYDVFGRDRPVFERTYIAADPTVAPTPDAPLRGAPAREVPDPPGFERTGDVPQSFELSLHLLGGAGGVGGARPWPREGFRAAVDPSRLASAFTGEDLIGWQHRGLVVVVPRALPAREGGISHQGIVLPPARAGEGYGDAAAMAGGAALVALLAWAVSHAGRETAS